MNEICQVHISMDKKRNTFWGLITGFDDNIYFDPFTVLTELRYKPDAIELEDDFFDDWDYSHEYAFGCQLSLSDYERKQYVYVVKGIKKLIKKSYSEHETIRLADLELLKSYFDITFNFTPIATIIKPKSLIPSERIAHNLSVHYSSFSIDHILNIGTKLYSEYFYQCYSMADILFSVLHFLSINDYKYNRCEHCGRYFATTNLKNLYCDRKSDYPHFEKLTCYEAVKRIRQDIQRKHRQIYKNLSANYLPEQLNKFESEYIKSLEELKKQSNYTNIDNCYKLLDKNRWYTKKSIRVVGKK